MPSPYRSLLLNELHEYFPDILYRPNRFQSVGDLLQYIVGVAQENPYDRMRAEYDSTHPPMNAVPQFVPTRFSSIRPQTPPPIVRSVAQTTPLREDGRSATDILQSLLYGSTSSERSSLPVNITSSLLSSRPVRMPFRASIVSDQQMVNNFINELLQPSQQMDLSTLESFLNQPVIVRPSEEEINRATIINCYNPQPYDNCAICQDAMEEGQTVRIIRYCSHKFHQECIDTWLQSHVTCPTCRHDIREN